MRSLNLSTRGSRFGTCVQCEDKEPLIEGYAAAPWARKRLDVLEYEGHNSTRRAFADVCLQLIVRIARRETFE